MATTNDTSATAGAVGDTVHVTIAVDGSIHAWGLNKTTEQEILRKTGNSHLAERLRRMNYRFCG
jgi:hypothetical protein